MDNNLHNLSPDLQEDHQTSFDQAEEITRLVERETLPDGFDLDEEGVWHIQTKQREDFPERVFVCAPLHITACTRDHKSEHHGRCLEFEDIDGHHHTWTMPMELLARDASQVVAVLLNRGLIISPARKARVLVGIRSTLSASSQGPLRSTARLVR